MKDIFLKVDDWYPGNLHSLYNDKDLPFFLKEWKLKKLQNL